MSSRIPVGGAPPSATAGGSLSARIPLSARSAPKAIDIREAVKIPHTARGRLNGNSTHSSTNKVKRSPSELIAQSRQLGLHRWTEDVQPRIIEFLNLSSFSHQSEPVVAVGDPLFKPTPSVLSFVDYEGLQTYDKTLSLRNQDNVARRIKVLPPDSSFFELLPGRGRKKDATGDRVAPGMEVSYIVRFKPDVRIDYTYDLVVVTEREKFIVPVRATGGSAILEFPDSISFGVAPVKYQTAKTVLVRNIGDKSSKFLLKTAPPFSTSVLDGYLEVNSSMQVDVFFKPDRAEAYEGELLLTYGDGVEAYVKLQGSAENVEITFSQDRVAMSDTFIALSTQSTIMVHNHSDVPVDFSWRAFPTIEEEIGQKLKLQVQLKQEESEECGAIMQLQAEDEFASDEDADSDTSRSNASMEEGSLGSREQKAVGALQRRYRNIAKAIMEDPMFFYDEIFAVEPLSGRIWAKSKATITITFTPKAALTYQCIAYCSIVGQADRMPLLLKGQGIGPKAAFSYDELDVGDVFVESMHQYEVELINQGDIAVNFQLVPNESPFGKKFTFTPSGARLEVGGQVTIIVDFCPDLLGEFHETFYWDLVGSASSIPLTFKGHSVSPTFHFDVDRISFGVVSFGFLNSKTLTLTNTSEVPMRFALRIPGDGRFAQREFDVIPPRGQLLPNCAQKVQIDFISVNIKTYDLCLVVDLDGVGQELASIPIQARCAVPSVTFEPQEMLEYHDIFIRYPAHRTLVLHNTSALPAKFQILPQDDKTRMLAEFEPDQAYGSVPPASSHVVTITLTSKKIGPLQIPLSCRVLGHNMPHQVMLTANSIGPIVTVEPPLLDWGNIKCLEPQVRHVKVTNDSVIDASVRAFMKTKNSLWSIEPKQLELKPHETVSLAMTLKIDETVKMSDLMHLVVPEGKDITVTVKAKGIDTPITCKESLDIVDFGTQYTTQKITRGFLIENRGRQQRKLVWVSELDHLNKKKASDKDKENQENVAQPVFSVIPDTLLLDGKCAFCFQFTAICPKPGAVREVLLCQEFAGNDRKGHTVFRTELCGNFVAPLLDLSMTTIQFKFLWEPRKPITVMSQQLKITNVSPLDVKFYLKVQPPFSVSVESLFLHSQESTEIRVEFDPGFKVDRVCGVVKQKLTVVYTDHPQKDHVNLVGEVVFPNIVLSSEKLDFGSVLNETTKQLSITISNPNVLPVNYEWMFMEEQEFNPQAFERTGSLLESLPDITAIHTGQNTGQTTPVIQSAMNTQRSGFGAAAVNGNLHAIPDHETPLGQGQATPMGSTAVGTLVGQASPLGSTALVGQASPLGSTAVGTLGGSSVGTKADVDINRIFDILPIMGRLEPGDEQTTTFTYFGLNNKRFNATAVCTVEGGPEYEVELKGQASRLEYRIDKSELDFGDVPFNQVFDKDIVLSNTGKVAFYYNVNLSGVSRPFVLDASPLTGLVNSDEKQKISIRFRAGIPDEVLEVAHIEVAHFEPTKLTVRGRGTFPGILISPFGGDSMSSQLTRRDEEDHKRRQDMARERIVVLEDTSSLDQQQQQIVPRSPGAVDQSKEGTTPAIVGPTPLPPPTASLSIMESDAQQSTKFSVGLAEEANAIEFEVDRNFLCEVLLEKEKELMQANRLKMTIKAQATADKGKMTSMSTRGALGTRQLKELAPMTAAYYTCDFGNIVLGQSGKMQAVVYNCFSEPVSFTVNRKMLQAHGYTVLPEKAKNLPAGKSMRLDLTCFRSKDAEEGRQELDWVIPLKSGPSYEVKLISNFVLPDLVLSPEVVEFGRVLVGQRKRVTVRLKNVKAVPVEWEYKAPRSKYGKALPPWEVTFTLTPSSGKLQPNETAWVIVSFTPNSTKVFNQKLALRINDNPNKKMVSLHGQGDALRVEVKPSCVFQLGPILPEKETQDEADQGCVQEVFLHNPTDYPIEVYSVDFDQKYIEEEGMLKEYEKYDAWSLTELPVRQPGEETWKDVAESVGSLRRKRERKRERERERQEAIERGEEPPEEDEEEEEQPQEVEEPPAEIDASSFPNRVLPEDRLNVIFVGPPVVGKTSSGQHAAETGRKLLSIDEVIEWTLSSPPCLQDTVDVRVRQDLLDAIAKFDEEHEKAEAEREEQCKKKKEPFTKNTNYTYPLGVDDVAHVIRRRTEQLDCNCGVIIDGFDARYLSSERVVQAVFTALGHEKFTVFAPALVGHLGFPDEEPIPLGVASPAIGALMSENEDLEKQLQDFTEILKSYYTELRDFLTGKTESTQEELNKLVEARDIALANAETAAVTEEEPDQETPVPTAANVTEEFDVQIKPLESVLETYKVSLSKLGKALEDSKAGVEKSVSDFRDLLLNVEAAAAKAKVAAEAEGSTASKTKKEPKDMKFEPPERQDEALQLTEGDDEAVVETETAIVDIPDSPFSLIPLNLDAEISVSLFEKLKASVKELLPAPLIPEEVPLPPPTFAQLVGKPQTRPPRREQTNFSILTPAPRPHTAGEQSEGGNVSEAGSKHEHASKGDKGDVASKGDKGDVASKLGGDDVTTGSPEQTRWIVEPHAQQRLLIRFSAKDIGTFMSTLTFEVVGGINGNAPVSIAASGITAFPTINSDPRNVFMRRIKSKPASGYACKQFVTSLGVYDFGPLLAGRSTDSRKPAQTEEGHAAPLDVHVRQHIESFRITNNSLFKAHIMFCLGSNMENTDGRRGSNASMPPPFNDEFPFIIEPHELHLEIDETREISVSCFPTREGVYSDKVVAIVEHNPQPVEFPICAIGSLPKVNMEMTELDFNRMLLKQKATNYIRFSNVCAVPVRWRLNPGEAGIPSTFSIDYMEGTMAVGEERSIAVTFRAEEPETHSFPLTLQIGDNEDLQPLEDTNKIHVKAEAFSVDVVPEFKDESRGLDFGDVQVAATVEQSFNVSNNGKYPVTYEIKVRRKAIRDILTVELKLEEDGTATIKPGEKKPVVVKLSPNTEMQCPDLGRGNRGGRNDELELIVYEARTGELVNLDLPPISLSFRSVFNSFSVTPPRGLNFGPVKMGETSTREFEIYNDGIFKFDWFLFDPSRPSSQGEKRKPEKGEVQVGPFKMKPAEGSLGPKESAKVSATFVTTDDGDFDCKFGFHVDGMPEGSSDRLHSQRPTLSLDPMDSSTQAHFYATSTGAPAARESGFREYLLTGQSCTPGIDTENRSTLFEEHFVARNVEDAIATAGRIDIRTYCEEDRVFSFGPVVVQGPSSDPHSVADAAKFRITNPKAIPCEVKLDVKPKGQSKDAVPFELSTDHLSIPPHEYRYVKVRFRPPSLQTYTAIFEASVPEGKDPKTNFLQFELKGDGTVPTVSLDGPPIFGDNGGDCQFGKLRVGATHTIDFVLRNDGIIPATARCEFVASPHFTIICPKSVPLEPKASHPLQVRFNPLEKGDVKTSVRLYTLYNQFEDTTIQFSGQGYMDDVTWDLQECPPPPRAVGEEGVQSHLPRAPDELHLGEVAIGAENMVTFYISNASKDAMRFQFPEQLPAPFDSCLQISPSVGHVLPKGRKAITFTFKPTQKMNEKVVIATSVSYMIYDGDPIDWDDSMRAIDFAPDDVGSRASYTRGQTRSVMSHSASKASLGSPRVRASRCSLPEGAMEEIAEEPKHRIIDGTSRDLPLTVSAVADELAYACSVNRINLNSTVMYQTKLHRFSVSNQSSISMPFEWRVVGPNGDRQAPGLHAYSVTPKQGIVASGASEEFTLRFSPKEIEAFNCTLECNIPHLSKDLQPLRIALDARASRPWCHFELPSSDYRSRRVADAPLDPKYKILEFESLGTRVKNTKRFYVLNPTAETYEFTWMPEDVGNIEEKEDAFRCLTKRGSIYSGKKYEMVFEYLPTSVGTHESFWTFSVTGKDAKQSFLVVGTVKEPRVGMDCPNVNFNRLLLGAKARETVHVVNKEHLPFSFTFSKDSYETEGQVPVLSVSPKSGVVGPGASFPVEVTFTPIEEKCYNFNLSCNVKRRAEPIILNVKGEGYKIHTKMVIEEKERGSRELLPGVRELLDFGSLQVQEKRSFTLRLSSPSFQRPDESAKQKTQDELDELPNMSFDFIWQLRSARGGMLIPRSDAPPYITVTPMQGRGTQESETIINIDYYPVDTHTLDGLTLRMMIPSGPGDSSYTLELSGRATRPSVDFSVTTHDFGPCFVSKKITAEPSSPSRVNSPYEKLDLIIINRDMADHWISTTFQKTSYLDVQLMASMIEAGASISVPIVFTPREYVEYRERIEFVINDNTKQYVTVRGRGCQLQLELASITMQNLDFGVTVGNQPVAKDVRIVNRSLRTVDFQLASPDGALSEKCVSWTPLTPVSLRPKEQLPVELRFTPEFRIAPFKLPLLARCNFGHEIHLLNVSGSCHTAEVKLSEHSVLFGDVVFQSTAVRKVHLHNFGDLGVKFRFEMPPKAAALFSIEPAEGFATPHDDVVLQVKFHPAKGAGAGDFGRPKKIRCHLDPSYQHDPIELIVQGRGIDQPEGSAKLLEFVTEVRETKKIDFTFPPDGKNATSDSWKLNPVVKTEIPNDAAYWFVPPDITVPAGGTANIEISYRPLTMTLREEDKLAANQESEESQKKVVKKTNLPPEKHVGKIFIATPDGNAYVLNLEGISLPTKDSKKLSVEVQCKKQHIQGLEVSNWLNEAQRFNVTISIIEPAEAREEIRIQGVETFDLPPGMTKEYKFNAYAYREGSAKAKVVFTNPKTDEFLVYEVSFKFVAASALQVIEFHTACRQTGTHSISLTNPLSSIVNFKCDASIPELRFSPSTLSIPPKSEAHVDIVFRPVLAGTGEASVKLSSSELGEYPYTVKYEALPAGLEKTIVFKAPLGSTDTVQSFKFQHYAPKAASYIASIEPAPGRKDLMNDFIIETKDIKAAAAVDDGVEVSVDIRFQPSSLGEIRALLVLSSPDGGDYKALLVGYTQPPQPQGPVDIAKGKDGKIEFNNPFEETVQFSVQVDNPGFVLSRRSFKLDAKKSETITVQFKGEKPLGGRLIVTAPKVSTPWIFFLKGNA